MKKLISLFLILCIACMLIPAMADDIDVTGEWYTTMMGVPMTLVLNADGTGSMTVPGQEGEAAATWTLEGDQITITSNDSPASGTATSDSITLAADGMEMIFTREPVEAITVADVKADAAAEEFYGDWTFTYMEAEGLIVDVSAFGLAFPNVRLAEGTVEFVAASEEDFYAAIFNMLGLASTYEDGVLKLASTAENATSNGTIEMLQDGMLKVTLEMDGEAMVLYYSPAGAAEEPAA